MTLAKGPGSMRANMKELVSNIQSPARRKAITTIAKKYNISFSQAQYRQAEAISRRQLQKK